ncbi:MAG: cytochrome c [Gemmataceae bacterium]|nr:cytochrome c [Gemmataceae bacterium]
MAEKNCLERHTLGEPPGRPSGLTGWWKHVALAALVLVGGGLLAGSAQPDKGTRVVEAERFVLRDGRGKIRAELGWDQGSLGLTLLDAQGKTRTRVAVLADGTARLSLHDRQGSSRAVLQVQPEGEPELKLYDKHGKVLAALPGPPAPAVAAFTDRKVAPASLEMGVPLQKAALLYRRLCLSCHGADGRGKARPADRSPPPDFTAPAWQASRSDAQLRASILNGRGADMPPFDDRLSATQVRELVAYVRAFNPAQTKPASAVVSAFEARFRELQQQWEELEEQRRKLSAPPRKP